MTEKVLNPMKKSKDLSKSDGKFPLSGIKTICKDTAVKKWGTGSIREVNQQNRPESLEMDLCMYGSLLFKVTPSQWVLNNWHWGEKKLSSNLYNK